jgi:UDP-N-acetylmuramate dehydrogenase
MSQVPVNLSQAFPNRVEPQASLAPYTYVKIGGPAQWLLIINNALELEQAITAARKDNLSFQVLGSASNVIISDAGISGLIIINRAQEIRLKDSTKVVAESGALMSQLVHFTLQNKLSGLEEFLGIPGTVGGAIYNNSHHLTHLIGDYVESVLILTRQGEKKHLAQADCGFAYDKSVFQQTNDIILSVTFTLAPATAEMKPLAIAALKRRKDTQPLEYPNSGCMFKNVDPKTAAQVGMPPGVVAAGWLVDQSGCKDMQVGQAKVSPKHANFIINLGGATAADYVTLSNQVRQIVHEKFGLWLDREIFFLGNHPGLEA